MKTLMTKRAHALVLATALVAVGCSDDNKSSTDDTTGDAGKSDASTGTGTDAGGKTDASTADSGVEEDAATTVKADENVGSKAANLRVSVNLLLSEHLVFAAKATGAALAGRNEEYAAYGDLLNTNGTDIGGAIGSIYGTDAETQFNGIWSAHNGFFVDYTVATATGDAAGQTKAVNDLTGTYVPAFAKFIADATGLPEATVTDLTTEHVLTTKAIVDAQFEKDWAKTYKAVRAAFHHMAMIGDPLSEAIAAKFPEKFPGDPKAASVDFRVALNELLQEHLYLATFATGSALGGRTDEFTAAGDALNENGTDLGAAITGLYGAAAGTKFNEIWSAHNGFFVDYTTAVATKNAADKATAVKNLTTVYVPDFAMFLAGATDLPEADLEAGTTEHVTTTAATVDAQEVLVTTPSADNATAVGAADRMAGQHMQMLGDVLAPAIVAKLPEKF